MLTKLSYGQSDRTQHVQAPSAGGPRHQIGARGLTTIGVLQRVGLQQGECGFFESGHRPRSGIGRAGALFESRGMEIFEVGDQLVDGRIRQLHAGLADMPPDFGAWIECSHNNHAS